jgi:hypothetical protein
MGTQTVQGGDGTNVTLVTTAETVVATLTGVSTPRKTNVTIEGWCQLTTGTNTTALTPRIRRGVDATGTLVGEANPVTIGAAAGGTEDVEIKVTDVGVDLSNATYVLTVVQTAASANGTSLLAGMSATWPD